MAQDYKWLALGGAFLRSSPKDRPLMLNASRAARLLDSSVDEVPWRAAAGLSGLHLVLQPDSSCSEPELEPQKPSGDGIRMFVVRYDWLDDRFTDPGSGAWNVLGVVCMVLAEISQTAGIPMPRLPSNWYGDPDSVPY